MIHKSWNKVLKIGSVVALSEAIVGCGSSSSPSSVPVPTPVEVDLTASEIESDMNNKFSSVKKNVNVGINGTSVNCDFVVSNDSGKGCLDNEIREGENSYSVDGIGSVSSVPAGTQSEVDAKWSTVLAQFGGTVLEKKINLGNVPAGSAINSSTLITAGPNINFSCRYGSGNDVPSQINSGSLIISATSANLLPGPFSINCTDDSGKVFENVVSGTVVNPQEPPIIVIDKESELVKYNGEVRDINKNLTYACFNSDSIQVNSVKYELDANGKYAVDISNLGGQNLEAKCLSGDVSSDILYNSIHKNTTPSGCSFSGPAGGFIKSTSPVVVDYTLSCSSVDSEGDRVLVEFVGEKEDGTVLILDSSEISSGTTIDKTASIDVNGSINGVKIVEGIYSPTKIKVNGIEFFGNNLYEMFYQSLPKPVERTIGGA